VVGDNERDGRVELRLDLGVVRLRPFEEVGHDDLAEGPVRRHFLDQRVEPVGRVRLVVILPEVVRSDQQQQNIRIRLRPEHVQNDRIDLIDPPSAVALVIRIRHAGRVAGLAADVVDVVPGIGQQLVQRQTVTAVDTGPVGDRIADRHDADRRRRTGCTHSTGSEQDRHEKPRQRTPTPDSAHAPIVEGT
jgi:hypothetical protein